VILGQPRGPEWAASGDPTGASRAAVAGGRAGHRRGHGQGPGEDHRAQAQAGSERTVACSSSMGASMVRKGPCDRAARDRTARPPPPPSRRARAPPPPRGRRPRRPNCWATASAPGVADAEERGHGLDAGLVGGQADAAGRRGRVGGRTSPAARARSPRGRTPSGRHVLEDAQAPVHAGARPRRARAGPRRRSTVPCKPGGGRRLQHSAVGVGGSRRAPPACGAALPAPASWARPRTRPACGTGSCGPSPGAGRRGLVAPPPASPARCTRARARSRVSPGPPPRPGGRALALAQRRRQVLGPTISLIAQGHRALDHVLQLAHVAGPVSAEEDLVGASAEAAQGLLARRPRAARKCSARAGCPRCARAAAGSAPG
jgi:hypothetical protein